MATPREKKQLVAKWDPAVELAEIIRDMPVLEGEEIWASGVIDDAAEIERWEGHDLTPWWPGTAQPLREGRYQVMLGTWPFPSFAEYSYIKGWVDCGGTLDNVTAWRGLANPDRSSSD